MPLAGLGLHDRAALSQAQAQQWHSSVARSTASPANLLPCWRPPSCLCLLSSPDPCPLSVARNRRHSETMTALEGASRVHRQPSARVSMQDTTSIGDNLPWVFRVVALEGPGREAGLFPSMSLHHHSIRCHGVLRCTDATMERTLCSCETATRLIRCILLNLRRRPRIFAPASIPPREPTRTGAITHGFRAGKIACERPCLGLPRLTRPMMQS
ncbi:hypothetical protein V8C26DRAFT_229758 [Trichoderma gracile]